MRLIEKIFKFIDKKIIVPITKFFVFVGEKIKITDKPLEKALSKKSSMIILSLVLAVIVFFIVDKQNTTLLETNAEVIYNVPLTATYNNEEYVVEGLPETVDITLIGTKANLYLAKQLPTQDVTVDLSDLKPGVHKVNLRYKQSITSVEYKLDPSAVTIVVSTKQSETRNIESNIVNLDKLDSKLAINDLKLDYDEVIIKGTKENLSKVSTIKALVNVNNMVDPKAGTNTLRDVPLVAYDENGEKMDVEMVPSKVTATIEVESPSKSVPIEVEVKGNVVFGKAVKNITTNVQKVTIYGSSETLDNTNKIKVSVDVNNLKSDKDYTITIKKPSGIREISEKTINVKVELDDEATTELSGVKLGYINLGSNYTVQATSESSTEVSVILKGVESIIKDITSTEVEAYVDLEGLGVGEHEVEVKVKGNDSRVNYSSKVTKTKIKIAEK
ncbi:MAG: hypothetical protein J6B64_00250 [Bacilli bacterium]|nr:hypothetical protein [Bacilli bacterium]MBP3635562.1 hypothetical protein [Bacilli bacterium]